MAIWRTYRIADAVTEIDEGKFELPFMMFISKDKSEMDLLFDTLQKEIVLW